MGETREPTPLTIQQLLNRHERRLLAYAARLLGDAEQARDVVQDTFLRWVRERRRLRRETPETVTRWLYTTCRNRAFDLRKREQRMKTREARASARVEHDHGSAEPEQAAEQRELLDGVWRWLDALPAAEQEALRLKFLHGLSYRQIAEVMDQSLGNVGFLLHKAMHALRRKAAVYERRGMLS